MLHEQQRRLKKVQAPELAPPVRVQDEPVVLRLCTVHDDPALERLAVLEGRLLPSGRFVVAEQAHRHQARDGARGGDDHRVADQDAAQQPIGALEEIGHHHGADVPVGDEVLQAVAVERHHRRLGDREERRQREQHAERREHPRERDLRHQARCSRTSSTKRLPG